MIVEFPEGYEEVETPREKANRLRIEGGARVRIAKEKGLCIRKADYGRKAVYRNEQMAMRNIPMRVYDMTLEEITKSANIIFADKRVMNIDPFPGEPVEIQNSCMEGAIAYPFQRRIRFGGLKNNYTMYHEISHILNPGNKHGYDFCRVLCLLLEWFENVEAANYMREYLQ